MYCFYSHAAARPHSDGDCFQYARPTESMMLDSTDEYTNDPSCGSNCLAHESRDSPHAASLRADPQ